MADYDDFDDYEDDAPKSEDGLDGLAGEGGGEAPEDDENSIGISRRRIREWLNAKRGWLLIIGLAMAQGIFATIMIFLRSEAKPAVEVTYQNVRDLAVEMLGHEVKINQIYQLIPMRGGKRMTIGLDIVLVLGQLPEERVEGADRPNALEIELFLSAIRDMEPAIRSMVNMLLQQIPVEQFGTVEAYKTIKDSIQNYVNDTLDRLDFGKGLRQGIGKRRVTDVLLPMFVRQMM